jgi:hypothetical protein
MFLGYGEANTQIEYDDAITFTFEYVTDKPN